VWVALRGEALPEISGWHIAPGPADARDLPAYFARGRQLTDVMKTHRFQLEDRLRLVMAHVGLFILLAGPPMALFGLEVLAVGMIMSFASGVLLAALRPGQARGRKWLRWLVGGAVAALAGAINAYLAGYSGVGLLYFAMGFALIGGWLQRQVASYPTSFDPLGRGSSTD
jgi:hypothetical protein